MTEQAEGTRSIEGTCRECGAPILWAWNNVTKKWIPLDVRPIVYFVRVAPTAQRLEVTLERRFSMKEKGAGGHAVSHFSTCPKADTFSSSRRPQASRSSTT